MSIFLLYILLAYLIGSIPTAIWYGRIFHKTDIRKHGSGNAGATNTIRTFGKKAGFIVLFIDIAKGSLGVLLPTLVSLIINRFNFTIEWLYYPELAFGLAAGLGHIYPIYEKFKGGKGVATLYGVILAIDLLSTLCSAIIFALLFLFTKRVSVGSIFSFVAFAVALIFIQNHLQTGDYILICIYPLLLIYTHRTNIKRLMTGTEPKMTFGKKKD